MPTTWFMIFYLLALVATSAYALGRIHAGVNYRSGYRAGYREGTRDEQWHKDVRRVVERRMAA